MDKLLDSLIDDRLGDGKTDEQILDELSVMTGMASGDTAISPEAKQERE